MNGICRERGWHRFVTQDPYGPDVERFDECLDCGAPAPTRGFDLTKVLEGIDDKVLASEVVGLLGALHANELRHPTEPALPGLPIAMELALSGPERSAAALVHVSAFAVAALRKLEAASGVPVEQFLQRWGLTYAGGTP